AVMEGTGSARWRALCRQPASTAAATAAAVHVKEPTERFTGRVDNYARYRPSYPAAAIDLLEASCGLSPAAVVADVGSGTGILTELLLARGARVLAVEPNRGMRDAAEARLGGQARFVSVHGTAEAGSVPTAVAARL